MRSLPIIFTLCLLLPPAGVAASNLPTTVPTLGAPSLSGAIDPSWAKAATLSLDSDFTYRRAATEPTQVRILQDGSAIYVAFDVTQSGSITANQHSNGSSVLSDDYVGVFLDPQGIHGYQYAFYANPIGTRYQTSSENSAYTPQWTAVAKPTARGYVVTMRIPLSIIRTAGSHRWRAQFERFTVATNSLGVWAYIPFAGSATDPTFMGDLSGLGITAAGSNAANARNAARTQIYGLGEATTGANGGNTSRIGADVSAPITPTASLVASLHPDFSNVESDQQTIAPTAFARQFVEVRPFFTQLSSFFNHNASINAPQTLYTPSIPTFAQGYGLEGTQGPVNFAAYDALSTNRSDQAEAAYYRTETPNQLVLVDLQRVNVDAVGLQDTTTTLDAQVGDPRTHLFAYTNNGVESGTLVTHPNLGTYHDLGGGYSTATASLFVGLQEVGAQFAPVDGFTQQSDLLGYQSSASDQINFSPKFLLHDIAFTDYFARDNNHFGQLSQTDSNPQVNIDFRDLMTVHVYASASGVRTFNDQFLPFDGNGALLGYRVSTNTPSYVSFTGGPFYHGNLEAWTYLTTLPVTRRIHLTLETDEDKYLTSFAGELNTNQWLERVSLDYQINKDTQFDLGVRRIIGANLPNSFQALSYSPATCASNPELSGCFVNASNVSLAFHFLAARNEFYVVYGDANNLSTEPALFVKWIRYVGAEKGA
jgi:hypothetical protein